MCVCVCVCMHSMVNAGLTALNICLQSVVYIDEFASRQAGRSGTQGRVADAALKHYIGGIYNDIFVVHKTCSPEGQTNLFKLKALAKAGPYKTIPVSSSLGKIVLVRRSKLLYLYDAQRGGALQGLVALGCAAGITDPQLILRELEGEKIIFPALIGPLPLSPEPSSKRQRI